jgi:hypothetical protein
VAEATDDLNNWTPASDVAAVDGEGPEGSRSQASAADARSAAWPRSGPRLDDREEPARRAVQAEARWMDLGAFQLDLVVKPLTFHNNAEAQHIRLKA